MIYYIYKITFLKGDPKGRYYLGKRKYKGINIEEDKYAGSGSFCHTYYKKYGKVLGETYTKEVLEINPSLDENDKREEFIIGDLWKTDILCMNRTPGGVGGGQIARKEKRGKSVLQYDHEGIFIEKFNSMVDAENKLGISHKDISTACRKKTLKSGGYFWRYESEPMQKEELEQVFKAEKAIIQYTPDLKFIKRWSSITEAANALNLGHSSISAACNHRKNVHLIGGCIWAFEGETPINNRTVPHSGPRKVKQFDKYGIFIKEYNTLREADKENGIKWQRIQTCCNRETTNAGGYIWRFSEDDSITKEEINKAIEALRVFKYYQLNSAGKVVGIYNSITEAAKASNNSYQNIQNAVKTCGVSKGFFWEKIECVND